MGYDTGDVSFIFTCGCLMMFMTPGLAFFYGGGAINRKSMMHTMLSSFVALPVTTLQFFICGYSLSFALDGGAFIGNLKYAGFNGIYTQTAAHPLMKTVPEIIFAYFQTMTNVVTPAIIFSGCAERMKMGYFAIFLFVWCTLVFDVLAYWAWAPNGWFFAWGGYDTAGGMAVEIACGFSSLAVAMAVGPRKVRYEGVVNGPLLLIGGAILWFGWLGFNAGSVGGANARACNAAYVTHLAASMGAGVWMLCEKVYRKKISCTGIISGGIAGLIVTTPAAGFIQPPSALALGAVAAIGCYATTVWRRKFIDETFDAFSFHGICGFIGMILTGVFASKDIIALDGAVAEGGWIDHHWEQVGIQLAGACAAAGWAFTVTIIIVKVMQLIAKLCKDSIIMEPQDNIDEETLIESAFAFMEENKEFQTHSLYTCKKQIKKEMVLDKSDDGQLMATGQVEGEMKDNSIAEKKVVVEAQGETVENTKVSIE